MNIMASKRKDSLSLAEENKLNGYIQELEAMSKLISPKQLGLLLNLLLVKNLKIGQQAEMAEDKDLEVLVNVLKKWNEVAREMTKI